VKNYTTWYERRTARREVVRGKIDPVCLTS